MSYSKKDNEFYDYSLFLDKSKELSEQVFGGSKSGTNHKEPSLENWLLGTKLPTLIEEAESEKNGMKLKGFPASFSHDRDQFAKDEQGRRRFHGAFTGGFSAGYFNSVGSKEGWEPQNFKSSRENRASFKEFKPEDLMDEEDKETFTEGVRIKVIHPEIIFGNSELNYLNKHSINNRLGIGYLSTPKQNNVQQAQRKHASLSEAEKEKIELLQKGKVAFGLGVLDDEDEEIEGGVIDLMGEKNGVEGEISGEC
ncbi:putative DUF1604 domain-containing protein [Monocercomonoides exilis]|uniref:putative DUF1604 domain-containing protein n=1 Tax=Monocercomonoides exilis TaxID=2049356 RepID=UPI0035594869|nr:putative DUF1604 domain-containing protein [Monocercomonoides exilis]|eukprot:MONOS_9243.1-p1 / transcript=MONOS_9243.1 / gene=MONOS_9243 / organism=Monocercomonoides_exilis_PA203 / gene_product=DUF1604 domain-containing protein / transcript_product=DUF1604 domain-containing protein / location=Mono_scaffold00374:21669-22601(-) / protein_length=252 / sequence_SO=supercontig / SO=protein_coding / is_pseudo=false